MKVFVPFEEALVDELIHIGEALIPFRLDYPRMGNQWEDVELLPDAESARNHSTPVFALAD